MNRIKFTTLRLFVVALLLCGLMIIQTPAEPTLQANGKIAFTSDRDGNQEIYLMNADGSGQTRLTNNSFSDDFPTWSPDGRTIAFIRQNGSISSINLMNADGTNVRQITTLPFISNVSGISWSPDGAKIAFNYSRDIFTINIDGSNRVNLTNGQFYNYTPSWSPDGSRIAFARFLDLYASSIHTMNADGSDVRQITPYCQFYCGVISPDWSPDGGRIAFKSDGEDGSDPSGILLVNPDGTNLQINPYGSAPKWSPDGTKIVFYRGGYSDIPSQILVMNRNGSGQTQLTNASPNNFNPDWQPLTPELGLIVTRSDDRNNATCIPGDCSLREAVNATNAPANGGTINFASGLTRITLANEIVIHTVELTINGLGANNLTIDGGAGTNRIFYTNNATVTISGVTLTGGNGTGGGISGNGGAIYADGSSLTLDGVHVTGNTSIGIGGGVYYFGGIHRNINSTISGNTAGFGGGIGNFGAVLTTVNSTISANTSTYYGGGIYSDTGNIMLRNVTITNNTAQQGGGIFNDRSEYPLPALLNFGNTIVAGNTATNGIAPEIWSHRISPITSAGGNLVGDSPGDSANIPIVYQPTDIRDTNPMLGALANNGGTTPTHALLAGSPIIDKGLNRLVSPLAPTFDQRGKGFARFRDGNGDNITTVDIGAFEVQFGATGARPTPFDFDGDGKADISIFRPASGEWWYLRSSDGGNRAFQFGSSTDKIVPADYTGDGKTDIAFWRTSTGEWFVLRSEDNSFYSFPFGLSTDIPVPADFDGNGKADPAIFRPSTTTWYIQKSTGGTQIQQFGATGDVPVIADYDGDNKADIAIFRPSVAEWWIQRSTGGSIVYQFGAAGDKPVSADYTGDGKADVAFNRPSTGFWYVLRSEDNSFYAAPFGSNGDILTPADYDGDGKTDFAVFRPGEQKWYQSRSQAGFQIVQFGIPNDKPVPNAFVP